MVEILNDEERLKALDLYWVGAKQCVSCGEVKEGRFMLAPSERDFVIAKAEQKNTLKQVIEWGDELCTGHAGVVQLDWIPKRKLCGYCWAELQKGVEK